MEEASIFVASSLGCLLLELHIAELMLASRFFFLIARSLSCLSSNVTV